MSHIICGTWFFFYTKITPLIFSLRPFLAQTSENSYKNKVPTKYDETFSTMTNKFKLVQIVGYYTFVRYF